MRVRELLVGLCVVAVSLASVPLLAGEPLVIKAGDGKFIPAAAAEWAKAGDSFRFVLKTGVSAPKAAAELKDKIAPISVEAPDELTLVFRGADLSEDQLLTTLAGLELGGDKAVGDALAALSDLGSAGAPSMGDMSSAGSIRASKGFELPDAADRKKDPANLVGEVIGFEPCKPMPIFHVKVLQAPTEGKFKDAFKKGQKLAVRGYYKVKDGSKDMDEQDPRTAVNLSNVRILLGKKVFGKPFAQDGDEWIMETIEPR